MKARKKQKAKPQAPIEIPRDAEGRIALTVAQASALWGKSQTRIKILIAQGRVLHDKYGQGPRGGARAIIIRQAEAPPDVARGELTDEQRAATAQLRGLPVPKAKGQA